MPNATNVCSLCDSSCISGNCTLGADPNFCTLCASSNTFLYNGKCILDCNTVTKVGIFI